MELKYPILLLIGGFVLIITLFIPKRNKGKYAEGIKIANTDYIRNTPYFQKRLKTYIWIIRAIKTIIVVSLLSCMILGSRLTKVDTIIPEEYNRDIVLCMDVSGSVDELNHEITGYMQDTVSSLQGERFGISIFNASSTIAVPMTDDYDYVLNTLKRFQRAYEIAGIDTSYDDDNFDEYLDSAMFLIYGTNEGDRGSSLIGDGLASCIYSFPNLEETERTRIIILSTDNELAGDPLLTLEDAAKIAKKNNIIVYGIETKLINKKDSQAFKEAAEITGGKVYSSNNDSVKSIVENINNTSKSMLKEKEIVVKTDVPKIPFMILFISIIIYIIIRKKVMV